MMGTNGVGMWGANSGWSAPMPQDNLWGQQAQAWGGVPTQTAPPPPQWPQQQQQLQPNLFASSNEIWAGSNTTASTTQKKDDVFGDIWGGLK